jgi:hypothetical protein
LRGFLGIGYEEDSRSCWLLRPVMSLEYYGMGHFGVEPSRVSMTISFFARKEEYLPLCHNYSIAVGLTLALIVVSVSLGHSLSHISRWSSPWLILELTLCLQNKPMMHCHSYSHWYISYICAESNNVNIGSKHQDLATYNYIRSSLKAVTT